MLNYLWLIPIFPLLGFAINGLFGLWKVRRTGSRPAKPFIYSVGCGSVLLALLLSLGCFWELIQLDPEHRLVEQELFTWIHGPELRTVSGELVNFHITWGLQLDPLSAIMILVVTGVGFLIHVYSIGYMAEEKEGFYRFFAYMNLFMFMMLILVLANNYLVMFVGWEGVGLCSYLLIGYYIHKKSAGDAAKKAFVVNRVGDLAFIIGMLMIFSYFGTLDFTEVFEQVGEMFPTPEATWGALSWMALLLFIGATGKSAQVPLFVWLPDAMEGPTPVSALIHAATMVTAGVYMVARSTAIYSGAPDVLLIIAVVGIFTALLAASIALFQQDIKRVLAYSTVSQLGYMFAALGVGAVAAGIFHLMTHAFFKALLFLGSGSVIVALHHEQDMRKMGGLKRHLPTTCLTMWVAALAIAGVPGLAGFFSKDEILWRAFSSGHRLIWLVGVLVAGMTAFYMMRLMFLTFYGEARVSQEAAHHLHESPRVMTWPLILLAVGAGLAGYVGLPDWLGPNRFGDFLEPAVQAAYPPPAEALPAAEPLPADEAHQAEYWQEILLTVFSVALAFIGIYLAYYLFLKHKDKPAQLREKYRAIHGVVYNKYYVDELYDLLFVNRAKGLGRFFSAFDDNVVDGAVNGSATITRISAWLSGQADIHIVDRIVNLLADFFDSFSTVFRRLQTGLVQRYALFFVVGIILVISLYLYLES
ncbi:NADH-quinone oxidoreductase subunit L [Acidobacteria bacterium AH-259-A15]|nr:NADH-quinone oxidoreductase subunit L [Acidobacteria bacterium AH-259-A15]